MSDGKLFRSVYRFGPNIMTPDYRGYFSIENGEVELSSGRGMDGELIIGVTVVQNGDAAPELSKMFRNEDFARRYIVALKRGEKWDT